MIEINPDIYEHVARQLLTQIEDGREFFNGTVEYDREWFYSTLTCTLLIGRDRHKNPTSILPVWWEFSICADGVEAYNDFSWNEFKKYLF